MAEVLCITGMHRSGTSLIASWLERCGMAVHAGETYPPGVGNPKGHFEDKDFADLQLATLNQLVPGSMGWKIAGNGALRLPEGALVKARRLVLARDAAFPVWGWKDPRTCLFLNDWKRLMPHMKVLLVWRPCLQVVASLTDRASKTRKEDYQIGSIEAVRIWLTYNRAVCDYKAAHPEDALLLPLEFFLRRDREVIELIRERLGVKLNHSPIAAVYDPSLLQDRRPSVQDRLAKRWYDAALVEGRLRELSNGT